MNRANLLPTNLRVTSDPTTLEFSGATHLFEEPGALEEVARQAAAWFKHRLCGL